MRREQGLLAAAGSVVAGLAACAIGGAAWAQVDYRATAAAPAKPCADLARFARPETTILSAVQKPASETLPTHCEVIGRIAPAVGFRIQLPDAWNGRFYLAGNGGLAGEPVENRAGPGGDPTAEALRRGFATAITDTGHDRRVVADGSFGADKQLLIDYAYRAIHETALAGKALLADYYDTSYLAASYYEGCSTGGRQGLMSAQRFPDDFDGVIAGAPISDYTGTMIAVFWTTDRAERAGLTPAQFKLVADAYDAKCDKLDGLEDGLVSNVTACAFTPSKELRICEGGAPRDVCVTAEQAKLLDEIVAGPSVNGKKLHAGMPVATMRALDPAQNPWAPTWIAAAGQTPLNLGIHGPTGSMAYMVYDPPRPGFDWRAFDYAKDPALLEPLSRIIDATDPDLDAFEARRPDKAWGGKLIMYHGTADPALVFGMSVDYRDAVAARYGDGAKDFYRFFPMTGMYHCRGGYGADRADFLEAIVQWVEGGQAPDGIVARQTTRQGETVRERPLCDYPSYPKYQGGDPAKAESFACEAP